MREYPEKARTVSSIAMEFMAESDIFTNKSHSIDIIKSILVSILKDSEILKDGRKVHFSRLVQDIVQNEGIENASKVMKKGLELTDDPYVAQQI